MGHAAPRSYENLDPEPRKDEQAPDRLLRYRYWPLHHMLRRYPRYPVGKGRITPCFLSDKSFSPFPHFRAPLRPTPHFTFPTQSYLPLHPPVSSPNASSHEDRRRSRGLLRWQVQSLPRVLYSPNSHDHLPSTQDTEQFTSLWKSFPRIGESSSSRETRMYYSPLASYVLWAESNVLGTSTVSLVAFHSLSILLLIPAPN